MVWPLVAMMAMSAAKAYEDQKQNSADKKANAEIERYSPWTHMQPGAVTKASTTGTLAGGLASGLAMEQGMGTDDTAKPEAPGSFADTNSTATKGASFDGTGVSPAQANGAAGSAMPDYSKPGAAYASYAPPPAAGQAQLAVGDPSTYPEGYDPFAGGGQTTAAAKPGKGWYGVVPKKS